MGSRIVDIAKISMIYRLYLAGKTVVNWGVDKTRNMEHPGTFRNIPEHEKIKIFFMKKNVVK